jgi:hypothetical protein
MQFEFLVRLAHACVAACPAKQSDSSLASQAARQPDDVATASTLSSQISRHQDMKESF